MTDAIPTQKTKKSVALSGVVVGNTEICTVGRSGQAEADIRHRVAAKEVIIGFGHPVYTVSDPRNEVIKNVAPELSNDNGDIKMFDIATLIESVMRDGRTYFPTWIGSPRFRTTPWGFRPPCSPLVRDLTHNRLDRACHGIAERWEDHPSIRQLRGIGQP
jgi:hypothetical protein